MTVKCITEPQKDVLIQLWREYGSITELALVFHRSARTIYRVLEERGFNPVKCSKPQSAALPVKPVAPIPKSAQIPLFQTFPHPATLARGASFTRGLRVR